MTTDLKQALDTLRLDRSGDSEGPAAAAALAWILGVLVALAVVVGLARRAPGVTVVVAGHARTAAAGPGRCSTPPAT